MMIEPSIDELLEKTDKNKYVLCNVVAKRAKEIDNVKRNELADKNEKSISIACREIVEGKVKPTEVNFKISGDQQQ